MTRLGKFKVVYADPPWLFSSNSSDRPGRNARRHYACMTVKEITDLPVREIAEKDALLLMWITAPLAHHANEVIRAWGFRPKSQVVWVKNKIGTGYWSRNRHELLHIATRGRFPCPRPALFSDSVIEAPRREHSRKPDEIPAIIDERLGDMRRIELFARTARPGWWAWGNEARKFP
nr:MT-A70 family methyltransferase [Rhodobacter sp. NTK016B]